MPGPVRTLSPVLVLLAPLLLAGCATGPRPEPAPVVATGPDQTCLPIARIRRTQVIDDSTIDFHMRGGQIFRSRLPNSCPQLGFNRAFSYNTSIPQLCSMDIITVVNLAGGNVNGARCGLGPFTPIAPQPRK